MQPKCPLHLKRLHSNLIHRNNHWFWLSNKTSSSCWHKQSSINYIIVRINYSCSTNCVCIFSIFMVVDRTYWLVYTMNILYKHIHKKRKKHFVFIHNRYLACHIMRSGFCSVFRVKLFVNDISNIFIYKHENCHQFNGMWIAKAKMRRIFFFSFCWEHICFEVDLMNRSIRVSMLECHTGWKLQHIEPNNSSHWQQLACQLNNKMYTIYARVHYLLSVANAAMFRICDFLFIQVFDLLSTYCQMRCKCLR